MKKYGPEIIKILKLLTIIIAFALIVAQMFPNILISNDEKEYTEWIKELRENQRNGISNTVRGGYVNDTTTCEQ